MPAALPYRNRTLRLTLSAPWLLIPLLVCCAAAAGGAVYIASGYARLASWYRSLNSCFYRDFDWQHAFFTQKTYVHGRVFAGVAVGVATMLALWFARMLRRRRSWQLELRFRGKDPVAIAALWLFQAATLAYGLMRCVPGYDEVFSAVNCAGMHPFQTASYYMLPNNHIFFNLLNAFLSRLAKDPLLTARMISAVAAFALSGLLYLWIRNRGLRVLPAVVVCAVVLLQFPVWAFSFQGRGYALYTLCAWTSFISVQYYFETGNRAAWLPLVLATLIGFWTIPSYLYWELAIVIYCGLRMIRAKKIDAALLRMLLLSGALVYLAFAPVLCFSGLPALAENRYVATNHEPLARFLPGFWYSIGSTVQYTFNGWVEHRSLLYYGCFAAPFLAAPFLFRRKIASSLLFLWIAWAVLFGFILYTRRYPYPRNLIAHASLVLVALLLVAQDLLARVPVPARRWQTAILTGGCIALGVHFARFNRDHIHDSIYFYYADTRYKSVHDAVLRLPPDAVVWISAEGFYWEYLCRQRGLRASMCERNNATHYIYIASEESLPAVLRGRSAKVDQADEYDILKITR